MKPTTTAIIGTILTGALCVVIFTTVIFNQGKSYDVNLDFNTDEATDTTIILPRFNTLSLDRTAGYNYSEYYTYQPDVVITTGDSTSLPVTTASHRYSYEPGVIITTDDSVPHPTITMDSRWHKYLKLQTDSSGQLHIATDFSSLVTTITSTCVININAPKPFVITVPPDMLRSIQMSHPSATFSGITVNNMSTDRLSISSGLYITFSNSVIGKINMSGLKSDSDSYNYSTVNLISHSKVSDFTISDIHSEITLDTDGTSLIDTLNVSGRPYTPVRLNIPATNISRLNWQPSDDTESISINRTSPTSFSF